MPAAAWKAGAACHSVWVPVCGPSTSFRAPTGKQRINLEYKEKRNQENQRKSLNQNKPGKPGKAQTWMLGQCVGLCQLSSSIKANSVSKLTRRSSPNITRPRLNHCLTASSLTSQALAMSAVVIAKRIDLGLIPFSDCLLRRFIMLVRSSVSRSCLVIPIFGYLKDCLFIWDARKSGKPGSRRKPALVPGPRFAAGTLARCAGPGTVRTRRLCLDIQCGPALAAFRGHKQKRMNERCVRESGKSGEHGCWMCWHVMSALPLLAHCVSLPALPVWPALLCYADLACYVCVVCFSVFS